MEKIATDERPAEAEEADLGAQLRSAVGRLYRRFRSERPEGGLGDAALDVLTGLHKRGPQSLTELSEHDRVSPASMSQTVNRLTSAGYAVRTGDPDDRRKVHLPRHRRRRRARQGRPGPAQRLARPAAAGPQRRRPRGRRPRHDAARRHRRFLTADQDCPASSRADSGAPVRNSMSPNGARSPRQRSRISRASAANDSLRPNIAFS